MPETLDPQLIRRAQAGNASALGTIYEHYQGDVFRFLYYQVGEGQTAEDLTAEVFLRVMRALPRYRQNGAPLKAWVFQIARNLAIDHHRKARLRNHLALEENLTAGGEHPEAAAERSLASEELRNALTQLTDDQRQVISLRFLAAMPIAEVAVVVGKNENAVKALQRRGLRALQRILAEWTVQDD